MRITKSHLEAKVGIINGILGHGDVEWNTIGAVRLYGAYGGTGIHRVVNASGGISELASIGTAKEAARFLDGVIAGLRMASE